MGRAVVGVICGLAAALSPAAAQQPNTAAQPAAVATRQPSQQTNLPPTLLPLLTTPEHRAALLRAAHAVAPPGAAPCPDANYVTTGDIGILVPPRGGGAGKVVQGVWKETIHAQGCGPERVLNAMTQVTPDGTLTTTPLLPGNTIADPQLQRDSVQYAAAGMGGMPPGCNQGAVVDTRYVGLDGQAPGTRLAANQEPQAWDEVWTLEACGRRVAVAMKFSPDATGTAIHASPTPQ